MTQRGRSPKVQRRKKKAKLNGENLNMSVPQIPGWETAWINDQKNRPYRLNQFDDWEFVDASEIPDPANPDKPLIGEKTRNTEVDGGSRVRMRVDADEAGPIYAYLMKKRKEFVEEDKREKFKRLDELDKQVQRGISPVELQYGDVKVNRA